jgi:CubicO group peptidase (beta-lactamase class C family)
MSNQLEKKIQFEILKAVGDDLPLATPGLCLQVVQRGRLRVDLKMGETFRFYDLASLTKILFTVPAFMQLWDEKRLKLTTPVSDILSWWPHKKVTVGQVLCHSAGLPWWAPFYKNPRMQDRDVLKKYLSRLKLQKNKKAVYSDLDFILLGFVLEELHGQDLLNIWQQMEWVDKTHLHFNVKNKPLYKRAFYAPTEKCPWRKKVLHGEVHDDNTWRFGGVSTHAGLFGTIDDVTYYGMLLRQAYFRKSSVVARVGDLASPAAVKKFSARAIPASRGDWASGFMMPTRGGASCGKYFSPKSFGHTGFTGTSFWFDPKNDMMVSLLSNRVHPTRDNRKFVELRPLIHDIVCRAL